MDGQGLLISNDKGRYEGNFMKGEKNGFGQMQFVNGASYRGLYTDGLFSDKQGIFGLT